MKITTCIFILISLFGSCENISDQPEEKEIQNVTREQLEQQFSDIEELIAMGNCTGIEQCSFIPYGRKACGGPQGYLIFSSQVETEKLQEMVDRYTKLEITYNEQNKIMSDCSIPAEPTALGCENGKCVRIQ